MFAFLLPALDSSALEPIKVGLIIAFLVVSLGIHEAAHGWTALKCGDTTARDLGRITLNPFAHIDLFMTIVLPLMTFFAMGFPFGGAKPVPVAFHNLKNPVRDMAIVAIAGPASNFLLAILFYVFRKVAYEQGFWPIGSLGDSVLHVTVTLNLVLAAFNLLPIPPLDGSRVMAWMLPSQLRASYVRLEPFGLLIVVIVITQVPQVRGFVFDTVTTMERAVVFIATLGGAW